MTQPVYADVKPYLDNGDALADIADDLSNITVRPILSADARKFLVEEDLLFDGYAGPGGTLQAAYDDATLPAQPGNQKAIELLWVAAVQQGRADCATTTQVRPNGIARSFQEGGRLVKALQRFANDGTHMTQSQVDDFLALGGGLKYPDGVTDIEVQAAIDAEAVRVAEETRQQDIGSVRANIENTWINPAIADGVTTPAELIAAIKAGL